MNSPRIAMLVHGGPDSIAAVRASGLAQNHPPEKIRLLFRERGRFAQAFAWNLEIKNFNTDALYVMNTALPGAPLACLWSRRVPFALDTGDVIYEMARRAGITPAWQHPLLRVVENGAQRRARVIVVRGAAHKEHLERLGHSQVEVIPDGFNPAPAPPAREVQKLREKLGLAGRLVIGVMGSLVHSPRLNICYGWDLVRALSFLRDIPATGVIIGDGDGLPWLREQARQHGVSDRVIFCGRIPYTEVPLYLRTLDIALSTQTNNLPGQVRTTGKLPEYMAAGRYVLASKVGEATRLLPPRMLVDYEGEVDEDYPRKLAERFRELWQNPELLRAGRDLQEVAEQNCGYAVLSEKFNRVIGKLAAASQGSH